MAGLAELLPPVSETHMTAITPLRSLAFRSPAMYCTIPVVKFLVCPTLFCTKQRISEMSLESGFQPQNALDHFLYGVAARFARKIRVTHS